MTRIIARRGALNTVQAAPSASIAIAEGDLCYIDTSTHTVKPATSQASQTTKVLAQQTLHDNFLGVSQDQRLAAQTKTAPIGIATTGTFEVPIADDATARDPGTLYGCSVTGGSSAYYPVNQQLEVVADPKLAVARLVESVAAHAVTALVEIVSTATLGGPQALAS